MVSAADIVLAPTPIKITGSSTDLAEGEEYAVIVSCPVAVQPRICI